MNFQPSNVLLNSHSHWAKYLFFELRELCFLCPITHTQFSQEQNEIIRKYTNVAYHLYIYIYSINVIHHHTKCVTNGY